VALVAGVLSPLSTVPPDILIDATGRVAIRTEGGRLIFVENRKARGIVAATWNRRMAQSEADAVVAGSADLSAGGQTAGYRDTGLHCDGQGCIYRAKGLTIALPKAPSALAEDCPGADLVLAAFSVGRNCPDAMLVIDGPRLKRGGAHAVWLAGGQGQETLRVEDVASQRGRRLWVNSGRSSAREIEGEKAPATLRHRGEAAR
jgi:competence protein ComEC